jgi:hypothetical protein
MMALVRLDGGTVEHLANWVGPMRYSPLCNMLRVVEHHAGLDWPRVIEGAPTWSGDRRGSRFATLSWFSDPSTAPICRLCLSRYRSNDEQLSFALDQRGQTFLG